MAAVRSGPIQERVNLVVHLVGVTFGFRWVALIPDQSLGSIVGWGGCLGLHVRVEPVHD